MANHRRPSKGIASEIIMVDNEAIGERSPLIGAGAGSDAAFPRDEREESWASDDFLGLPWYKRPSVYWLLGPYFLFTLAFGGIIVPKLNLIVDLVCRGYMADQEVLDPTFTFTPVVPGGDNPQCRIPAVQRNVATFTLIASVLTGALSALVAPKLGSLSDRYGRTSLLTVASCGGVVNEIITIFAAKYPDVVDYHWLLAGAFFDGITGSITAGTVLASSYTSDCSPPSKRGVRIGYMHACFFTGLAFGPLIAGYLVKWTGTLLSIFYVALGCHIFFILFIFFVTPESLSKKRQMLARQKHQKDKEILAESIQARLEGTVVRTLPVWVSRLVSANPLEPLRILVPSGPHRKRLRRNMVLLALMDAIIISVAMGSGAVTILYVEYIFSWDILNTSRFVSFMSFTRVAVLLGLFPLVNYIFRIRPMQRRNRESGRTTVESNAGMDELDVWMLRIALVSDVCGTIGYIFSRSPQLFVFSSVVSSVGGLGGAVIQSAITKHVPAERVGSLLGALGLLHALGRVLAPMLFNGIYAATVDTFPQAFFVMLVSLFGLALIGSLFVRPHLFLEEDGYVPAPQDETFGIGFGRDEEVVAEAEIATEAFPRV